MDLLSKVNKIMMVSIYYTKRQFFFSSYESMMMIYSLYFFLSICFVSSESFSLQNDQPATDSGYKSLSMLRNILEAVLFEIINNNNERLHKVVGGAVCGRWPT